MGLVLGSTKLTVFVGSKKPLLPLERQPFHRPGEGALAGLHVHINMCKHTHTYMKHDKQTVKHAF